MTFVHYTTGQVWLSACETCTRLVAFAESEPQLAEFEKDHNCDVQQREPADTDNAA